MNAPQHGPGAGEVASLLADRIVDLVHELLPNGHREGAEWRVGSVQGEVGKSLGVRLSGAKRGVWRDFASAEGGDGLDLVQAAKGFASKRETIAWAKSWLGLEDGEPTEGGSRSRDRSPPQRDRSGRGPGLDRGQRHRRDGADQRYELARRIWRQSQPAVATLVERYLRSRGITIPPPPSLRYHGALRHRPTNLDLPTMIAAVQASDRSFIGVHRTYLTMDGTNKAPVSNAKMILGRVAGGAVRLGPVGARLGIAEGIESALAAMQACPNLVVWAALSTSGIRAIELPAEVRDVVILADGDGPGEEAAQAAARRFAAQGRQARIARPPAGQDFNDLLTLEHQNEGAAA